MVVAVSNNLAKDQPGQTSGQPSEPAGMHQPHIKCTRPVDLWKVNMYKLVFLFRGGISPFLGAYVTA